MLRCALHDQLVVNFCKNQPYKPGTLLVNEYLLN
jgi:hypothetical protein